jgi:hypothetical protein
MEKRTLRRASNEAIKYFLEKHREQLMKWDNQYRREVKQGARK